MKMNMTKWMKDISLSGHRLCLPILTFPLVAQMDFDVRTAVSNGEKQYELMKAVADRYPDMIAAITNMDLSVEAEAFGSEIRYGDAEVPTVVGALIKDIEDIPNLAIPEVGTGRTGEYLRAARLAVENISDRPVLGGCIGPFSLAGRLIDMFHIMEHIVLEPEAIHDLLEKCVEFLMPYVKAFKDLGANGIIMAEPAAGLLSEAMCEEFSSQYVKRFVDEFQDDNFVIILHNCGNTKAQISSLVGTGVKGIHFGNAVNMTDILPQIPWGVLALGNLDPSSCFTTSTPEEVAKKTRDLLTETAIYKNFVISSGCDIPPHTPLANVDSFFDEAINFNSATFSEIA